jgi:CIC family chloride channel protein
VPSVSPTSFALVAMAAAFGAATRAPFAAIVFVFELTRDYDAILLLMLATVLAEIVTRVTLHEGLMTEKLARRRVAVPGDYRPDVMATTHVGEIMSTDVVTVAAADTVLTALQRMLDASVDHLPVLDGDRLVGIRTRTDVLRSRQRALAADRPEPGWLARLRVGEA